MWRILQFSYKYAGIVAGITLLITALLALQLPKLQIKVSSDELIPEGSHLEQQYEKVRDDFGSDEVAVVYVEDSELFTQQRLKLLKELNTQLKQLPTVERIESLFTVSNISGEGGWVNTSPLLERIPRSERLLEKRQQEAVSNPILLRNVISPDGDATTLTLYLRSPEKLKAFSQDRIEELDNKIAALRAISANAPSSNAQAGSATATPPIAPSALSAQSPSPATAIPATNPPPITPTVSPAPSADAKISTQDNPEIQALLDERKNLERYLDESKHAKHVYEDIERLLEPLRTAEEHTFDKLFQVGSPAIQEQMTQFILNDQKVLLPLSMIVLVLLIGFMLQSVQGAIIPVLNAVIAAVCTLGMMALLGVPINMLNYIVPALILVIGATEDVHILVEYKEIRERGWRGIGAITDVGHNIGLTLALTGITTVLGFAATGLTDIKIMRDFGITAALGMFARFLVSIFFLPAYLRIFGRFFGGKHRKRKESWANRASAAFASMVMNRIVPKPYHTIGIVVLLCIPCLYFLTEIKMSNDLLSFLKQDSKLVREINTLSNKLSGTKVIYLTLEGNEGDFKRANKVQTLAQISNYLREMGKSEDQPKGVFDTVISLADYLALVNRELMYDGDDQFYDVPKKDDLIAQYLLFFHHDSMLKPYVTGDYARANIVIRCNINDSHELNTIVEDIRNTLDSGKFGPLLYTLTGKSVIVAQSVDQLSRGQTASISFMALALFVIVAVLFISFKAASMTVLSNLFAVIVLFGIMGIFGIPLNVGTCMVAAITIGIGIDDTLHLMVRYNKELKRLKNELPAIERAVKAEFMPVLITTLGLAGGFGVLASSSFVPVMQFGALSALVIFLAVIADLILTPVLLSKTRLITIWDLVGLNLRKALMNTSPVFKGMSSMQAKKLILASNVQEYPAGSKIVKANEDGDKMYVVLEGDLEVFITQGDNRILLSYLSMGEVFGEIALISRTRRTADVVAKTDTKLLVYDWESLVKLRRFAPYLSSQLLLNLANILGMRLVDAQRKIDNTPKLTGKTQSPKRGRI